MWNKVFNENCLDTLFRFDSSFIDLIITSPPYEKLRKYKGFIFPFEPIARELFRTLKPNGTLIWVVADQTLKGTESGNSFKQALFFMSIGFNLHDTMIWDKVNVFGTAGNPVSRYQQAFEYIFVFSKGKPKTFNALTVPVTMQNKIWSGSTRRDRRSSRITDCLTVKRNILNKPTKVINNIFKYEVGFNKTTSDKIAFDHPAIFPDKLAEDMILSFSNENDLVYDPFAGSGTVLKMALLNKRRYIGSEISADYCNIIRERLIMTL